MSGQVPGSVVGTTVLTGPFAIAPASQVSIPLPGGVRFGVVVLQNLSPLAVQVSSGPNRRWLAPWTEDVYAVEGTAAPLGVNAPSQVVPPGVEANGSITATWYLEGPPAGSSYPSPLASPTVTVTNTVNNPVFIELPPPPVSVLYSNEVTIAATGVKQALPGGSVPLTVGLSCLAPPTNAQKVRIAGTNVTAASYGIPPGYTLTFPIANVNIIEIEGTINDLLEVWGS